MKRKQIVERIAEDKAIPHRTAGDWLDNFVHELIEQLKAVSHPPPPPPEEVPEGEMKAPEEPQRAKGRR